MGIDTSAEHGGAESSFTSAIIAIEELAKVDPSVSVLCDVHNTLVNTIFRTYGNKEQQDKWLPLLAESKVLEAPKSIRIYMNSSLLSSARLILSVRTSIRFRRVRSADPGHKGRGPLGYQWL
jgi:hypothetical protein